MGKMGKTLNASVATDLDGRCAINIGRRATRNRACGAGMREMGRASWIFPAAVHFGILRFKSHSPIGLDVD